MSGRPKNLTTPNWLIPVWAPDTSYPISSDPWSATPTKVAFAAAASVGITPKTPIAAQIMNKALYDAYVTDGTALAGMQTLRDEAQAVLDYAGTMPALNFGATVGSIGSIGGALYNPSRRSWYIFGSSANVRYSRDFGNVWSVEPITGAAGTESIQDGDVDSSGNMVLSNNAAKTVFELTSSTWTWTKRNIGAGGTVNGDVPQIVYDPVHSLWCWVAQDSLNAGGIHQIYTSSNRVAWTQTVHTLAGWKEATHRLVVSAAGRIVSVTQDWNTATAVRVGTSDDGGLTWTDRGTFTTAVASPTEFHLSATDDGFIYVIGATASPNCEVWTSPDGVTWTKVATLTTQCLTEVAAYGAMLATSAKPAQEVVYSLDNGATWQWTGRQTPATPVGVVAGAGGLLAVQTGSILPPFVRGGTPNLGSLT